MNILTQCSNCKKDILIKLQASTRPDLQMEKGNEFEVKCNYCGNRQNRHVNDIRAEVNNNVVLLGFGIGALVSVILWNFYGAIGAVSMTIPLLIWKQQMNAVKTFNSYLIRRK